MNWIIQKTKKLKFHTDLDNLLIPIENDIKDLNWLISDLEVNSSELEKLPINNEKEWYLISSIQLNIIRKTDTQIIWGVFSGILNNITINPDKIILPFADGNGELWENKNLQLSNSKIEIIAWDSTYTIVKFTDKEMSDKFKLYFQEAIPLEKFK